MNGLDSIKNRTLLYRRITGRHSGQPKLYELMDFCIVNTTLGAMIEPRSVLPGNNGGMTNSDVYNNAFTEIIEATDQTLGAVGFAGTQWPRNYNAQ